MTVLADELRSRETTDVKGDQGRRVGLVTQTAAHTFIYDGWNVVLELVEHDSVTDRIEYFWGKDISSSAHGRGFMPAAVFWLCNQLEVA